jgi:hypothetical protein
MNELGADKDRIPTYQVPERWEKAYDTLVKFESISAEESLKMLMEICAAETEAAELRAKNKALEAQLAELAKPVSDEEWRRHSCWRNQDKHYEFSYRKQVDELITTRAAAVSAKEKEGNHAE